MPYYDDCRPSTKDVLNTAISFRDQAIRRGDTEEQRRMDIAIRNITLRIALRKSRRNGDEDPTNP